MALAFTAAQARASDAYLIDTLGVPGVVLMENAGRGVVGVLRRVLKTKGQAVAGSRVAVICGAGQNGGDGFVIARHLFLMGAQVQVYLALPRDKISGDALRNLQILEAMSSVPLHNFAQVDDPLVWRHALEGHVALIDAVFGIGLKAEVAGVPAVAIAAMNATAAVRVAVDLPSGLDADTGQVKGVAVQADVTATMATYKLGLLLDAGSPVGQLHVVSLGAPVHAPAEGGPYAHWIDEALVRPLLPRHLPRAHKGSRGHLLLVAGSPGKTGAAVLAGQAAMRAGAGLVTLGIPRSAQAAVDAKLWEVMSAVYSEGDDAEPESAARLTKFSAKCKAVALGPGIPTGPNMQALVHQVATLLPLPMVVDADGLNHLGTNVGRLHAAAGPRVLTPHPAEMGRLLGLSTHEVQSDRLGCARKLAGLTGAVVVLKGARTLVAEPNGNVFVNPAALASLGTAGSGDVLTGIVGAFLAQGLSAIDAAVCAVFVHGRAGASACEQLQLKNLVASDLPDAVARELQALA